MIKIEVKTNRVFFEQFPTMCGAEEQTELRKAWESAVYETIEKAGFTADTRIGTGHDPAVDYAIAVNDLWCSWSAIRNHFQNSNPPLTEEVEAIAGELTGYCDDCSEKVTDFVQMALPSIIFHARQIAEQAREAGESAATKLSDEFVCASEGILDEE